MNEESGGAPLVVAMLGKNVEGDGNEILKRMGKIMRLVLWKIWEGLINTPFMRMKVISLMRVNYDWLDDGLEGQDFTNDIFRVENDIVEPSKQHEDRENYGRNASYAWPSL